MYIYELTWPIKDWHGVTTSSAGLRQVRIGPVVQHTARPVHDICISAYLFRNVARPTFTDIGSAEVG